MNNTVPFKKHKQMNNTVPFKKENLKDEQHIF
jgi:hypothetical protein